MEVFYCSACRRRVTEQDLDQGGDVRVGDDCYCPDCVRADLPPPGTDTPTYAGQDGRAPYAVLVGRTLCT